MTAFNNLVNYSIFAVALLIGCLVAEAKAADIYRDDEKHNWKIHLDGEIRRGDAERLAVVMSDMKMPTYSLQLLGCTFR